MHNRLDPHLTLNQESGEERTHPTLGPGAVGHVNRIDARFLERSDLGKHGPGVHTLGRHDFHRGDESSARELLAQAAPLRQRHRLARRRHAGRRHGRGNPHDRSAPGKSHHGADVLGSGAAAATDDAGAGFDHAAGVTGHVLGTGHVDLAVTHVAWQARVGLGGNGDADHARQGFDRFQDAVRPHTAVDTYRICAACHEVGPEAGRIGSESGSAIVADGHLGDDRQVAFGTNRGNGRADLIDVAEGFQQESIDSTGEEAAHLAGKGLTRLVHPETPEGLEPHSQRADGPGDCSPVAGGITREPGSGGVDALGLVGEPVACQLHGVGAEGVGLQEVGAGAEVLAMDVPNQVGLPQVQFVVADVEEDAPGVKHGAHRAIAHVDPSILQQRPDRPSIAHRSSPRLGASQRSASATLQPLRRA